MKCTQGVRRGRELSARCASITRLSLCKAIHGLEERSPHVTSPHDVISVEGHPPAAGPPPADCSPLHPSGSNDERLLQCDEFEEEFVCVPEMEQQCRGDEVSSEVSYMHLH